MTSVNEIINSPKAKPRDGENYVSTLCTGTTGSTGSTGSIDPDYSPNEYAYTVYETVNFKACNYVRIMNSVFIDAFEPIDDVPTLLELIFYTDFFFALKPDVEPEYIEEDCEITNLPRYNPDIMVKTPLESSEI
jgi:hypothetical protein